MNLDIAVVASIVALCYFIGMIGKAIPLNDKWIPIMCGGSGIILGIFGHFIGIADLVTNDIYTAAAMGLASGLAATGVNQVYKQLKKG